MNEVFPQQAADIARTVALAKRRKLTLIDISCLDDVATVYYESDVDPKTISTWFRKVGALVMFCGTCKVNDEYMSYIQFKLEGE